MTGIEISALSRSPTTLEALSAILVDTVASGGSVSFLHPLAWDTAINYWVGALAAASRDERIILGAWAGVALVGTVTLMLDCPPNQPHRAEIVKLMTHPSHRRQGIAATLMRAAEERAVVRQRTLLVLDTAADGGASGLYESLGYVLAGVIPDYALKPHGGLSATRIYWKRVGGKAGGDGERYPAANNGVSP